MSRFDDVVDVYLSLTDRPEDFGATGGVPGGLPSLPTIAATAPDDVRPAAPALSAPQEEILAAVGPPAPPPAVVPTAGLSPEQERVLSAIETPAPAGLSAEQEEVLQAVSPPPEPQRRPLLAAAAQDLLDMIQGIGQLTGSVAAQAVPYLPGLPEYMRPYAEAEAARRRALLGSLVTEAPKHMVEGLYRSFTSPVEAFQEHPLFTLSDWAFPLSAASFTARQAGRVAGVLGRGAAAAQLFHAADALRPLNVLKQGLWQAGRIIAAPAGVRVPPLQAFVQERQLAKEAGRTVRRTWIEAQQALVPVIERLERAWKAVPDADRQVMVEAIEGTLDPGALQRLSPEAKQFVDMYRHYQAGQWEPAVALVLAQGNPQLVANYLEIFSLAKYKPLAQRLTAQATAQAETLAQQAELARLLMQRLPRGDPRVLLLARLAQSWADRAADLRKGVSLQETRALVEAGRLPHLADFPPTYYPHRFAPAKAPHASLRQTLESALPGPLTRRKGAPGFERDALRAISGHYNDLTRELARYQAIMQVVREQGQYLGSYLSRQDLAHALDQLYRRTGRHWVWFVPEIPHRILAIRQRLQVALEQQVRGPGGAGQTFAGILTDGLQRALKGEIEDIAEALRPPGAAAPEVGALGPKIPPRAIYAIPEATAKRLLAEVSPSAPWQQALGGAMDVWRAGVLALSPRWYVQNAFGNFLLALLSGTYRPDQVAKIRDVLLPDIQTASLAAEIKVLRELAAERRAESRVGPFHWGQWAAALERRLPLGVAQDVIATLYDLNTATDRFFREAVFAGKVRQQALRELRSEGVGGLRLDPKLVTARMREIASDPKRARAAIDWVQRWMGNYFDTSPAVRRYLRDTAFPFWSWYRSMAKLVATLPVDTPGRTIALSALATVMVEAERDQDPMIPPELRGRVAIGVTPDGYLVTIDAQSMVPWNTLVQGIPALSPAAALAVAALSGSTFFGRLQTEPGLEFAGGRYYWSDLWPPEEVSWLERRSIAVLQTVRDVLRIPLVRAAESLVTGTSPVSGQPLFRQRPTAFPPLGRQTAPEAWASWFTGLNVREFNEPLLRRWYLQRLKSAYRKGLRTRAAEAAEGGSPTARITEDDLWEWLGGLERPTK